MRRLYLLSWCSAALAAVVFWNTRPQTTVRGEALPRNWLTNGKTSVTPNEHCRAPDQTFLTYPEWFLVFGPAEYAEHLKHHTSTSFPLMTHVFQAWESYEAVKAPIRDVYPRNDEYHTMIQVINTSSTIEFSLKAIYEALVGRFTDVGDGSVVTAEDRFNADYAQAYVSFLDTAPWYEFDFLKLLRCLWTETPLIQSHPLRQWERRYFLTTELLVKAGYGQAIKMASQSAYDAPAPVTVSVVNRKPPAGIKVLSQLPDERALIELPRYTPFTPLAIKLAKEDFRFQEIAGNSSSILISTLAPPDWKPASHSMKVLFTQTIPTQPDHSRWVLVTPVLSLHETLTSLEASGVKIEHVFDY